MMPSLSVRIKSVPLPPISSSANLLILPELSTESTASGFRVNGIGTRGPACLKLKLGGSAPYVLRPRDVFTLRIKGEMYQSVRNRVEHSNKEVHWHLPLDIADLHSLDSIIIERLLNVSMASTLNMENQRRMRRFSNMEQATPRTISQVREERSNDRLSSVFSSSSEEENTFDVNVNGRQKESSGNDLLTCFLWQADDGLRSGFCVAPSNLSSIRSKIGADDFLKLDQESVAKAITCKLCNPAEVYIPSSGSGVSIPVALKLRSHYHLPVFFTVEAVDSLKESDLLLVSSTMLDDVDESITSRSKQLLSDGLCWIGKTAYHEAELPPYEEISIGFTALANATGAYDLRRFKVIITNKADITFVMHIPGQNVVIVLPLPT